MENFDNFGEFPIVLGVNRVRFPKKFTHVIFSPKRNTKKKVGIIGQCRGNSLTLIYIPTQFPESETIELLRLNYLMLCELSCTTILIKLQCYNFFCQQIADVGSKH